MALTSTRAKLFWILWDNWITFQCADCADSLLEIGSHAVNIIVRDIAY